MSLSSGGIYNRVGKGIPTVSLGTVWGTLRRLEEEGLVFRLEVLNERARFDANPDYHHHFVCTECGLVRGFCSRHLDDYRASKEMRSRGSIQPKHMELRGTCLKCLAKR